jgi:hypothetical protein
MHCQTLPDPNFSRVDLSLGRLATPARRRTEKIWRILQFAKQRYAGDQPQQRSGISVVPFFRLPEFFQTKQGAIPRHPVLSWPPGQSIICPANTRLQFLPLPPSGTIPHLF